MAETLPVNIDSTYADDAGDASVQLHQQHHDRLHRRFNLVVDLDDPANGVPQDGTTSAKTALDAIYAAAPNVNTGQRWLIRPGDRRYNCDTGLAVVHDKAVSVVGVPGGRQSPDGNAGGSRFYANANGATIMTFGSGADIYQGGPHLADIAFEANGKTDVRGLKLRGVNHGKFDRLAFYEMRYGIVGAKDAAANDNAWNDFWAPHFYRIGILETGTNQAAAINFGNQFGWKIFGGMAIIKNTVGTGDTVGLLCDGDETGATSNERSMNNRVHGFFIDGDGATSRCYGIKTRAARFNYFDGIKFENLLRGWWASGGNQAVNGNGRGNWLGYGSAGGGIGRPIEATADCVRSGFGVLALESGVAAVLDNAPAGHFISGTVLQ